MTTSPELSGQWLTAALRRGRGVKPPPGLNSGEETTISISVDHIVAVTSHHYAVCEDEMSCCTNLLLVTGQWITVCGHPDEYATLLGLGGSK